MRKFLLSLLIITISIQPVMGAIRVNGIIEPVSSVNKDGTTLVSVRGISELLGAKVDWNSVKRCVTVIKGGEKVVLYVDTNTAEKDGKVSEVECAIIDGTVMVPLRFVSEAFGAKVDWNEATGSIAINTGESLLNLERNVSADTISLTFDEAYQLTIKQNSGLKTLKDSESYLEETKDNFDEALTNIDNANSYISLFLKETNYNEADSFRLQQYDNMVSTINVLRNMLAVDKQKDANEINEKIIKDLLDFSLRSSLYQINAYEMNLVLLEQTIAVQEESVKNIELKHSLGYESDYKLNSAKNELETTRNKYDKLKLDYDDAKIGLNKLLGIDAKKDVFVSTDALDDGLKDFNLETHIFKSVNSDLSIKLKQMDFEQAQYNWRTNVGYADESKIKLQNEYNAAKRALDDAKLNLEKSIRSAYNDVEREKENGKALSLALDKAKEDYNTAASSYAAGNATLLDTKSAKVGILKSEIDLELSKEYKRILEFSLERPYLLVQLEASKGQ